MQDNRSLLHYLTGYYHLLRISLCILLLCGGVHLGAQEKSQSGEGNITADSYSDFLTEVGKQDPHHLFEEKNSPIKRLGQAGSYQYGSPVEKEHVSSPLLMSFLDAARYCNWKNRPLPHSMPSSEESTEDGAYHLDGEKAILTPTELIYSLDATVVDFCKIDPLLKSNLLSFKLLENKNKLSQASDGDEESEQETTVTTINVIETFILIGLVACDPYFRGNRSEVNRHNTEIIRNHSSTDEIIQFTHSTSSNGKVVTQPTLNSASSKNGTFEKHINGSKFEARKIYVDHINHLNHVNNAHLDSVRSSKATKPADDQPVIPSDSKSEEQTNQNNFLHKDQNKSKDAKEESCSEDLKTYICRLFAVGIAGHLAINIKNRLSTNSPDTPFVTVTHPGNLPDPFAYPHYWGSVPYEFQISQSPVTLKEWVDFLNSVARTDSHHLYNEKMAPEITRLGEEGSYSYQLVDTNHKDYSITYVSYLSAQRFCNWKENGQKQGDTEHGSYNLTNLTSDTIGTTSTNARYRIVNNDEYQKTHFYDPLALANHGCYQSDLQNSFGTEPSHSTKTTFNEWTSTEDPNSKGKLIIRGEDDSISTTADPSAEREDLGFSIVKVNKTPDEEEQKKQKIAEKDHDKNQSKEENDSWYRASQSIQSSIDYSGTSKTLSEGYSLAASFYLASIDASLSKRPYSTNEQNSLRNAAVDMHKSLENLKEDNKDEMFKNENGVTLFLKAARNYKSENFSYADQYFDQGCNIK